MNRCVIQSEPIDIATWRARLEDVACGAAVFFEGRVRDHNEGRAVGRLEYEAHAPIAEKEGTAVIAEARARWPVSDAFCVHRTGVLELGDVAVLVGAASAHRDAAFEAARYIIEQVKLRLPIWKKEHYLEGEAEWVNCKVEPL
jgi:molybdopterin synthase catalytic subunit